MINTTLLTSNVNTNEVAIELKGLIDTIPKIASTNRYCCWSANEEIFSLAENLNEREALNKIYRHNKKPNGEVCFFDDILLDSSLIDKMKLDEIFFLLTKEKILILFSYIFNYKPIDKIAFLSEFDKEFVKVFYLSPFMNEDLKSKFLNKVQKYFEAGFFNLVYIEIVFKTTKLNKMHLYTSLKQVKDNFIKFHNLKYGFFEKLINYLFHIYYALILAFTLHNFFNFIEFYIRCLIMFSTKCIRLYIYHIMNLNIF